MRPTRLAYGYGLVIALLSIAGPRAAAGQAGDTGVAVLLVAHGAGAEWNAPVYELAEQLGRTYTTEVAFLMGEQSRARSFQAAAQRLADRGAQQIVVVPLFLSSHGFHADQVRYLAGATDSLSEAARRGLERMGQSRPELDLAWMLTPALDDAPELAEVVADRARSQTATAAAEALFLVAHGPTTAEDAAEWMRNLRLVAERVRVALGFVDVKVGLLRDDAPPLVREEAVTDIRGTIELQQRLTGRPVNVVPLLISRGPINDEKVPRDLAGLDIRYTGEALLPHPAIERWVLRRVGEALARAGAHSP